MDSDINVLQSRKIHFKKSSCDERLNEFCTYLMNQLPVDTIYLLPTFIICNVLNTAMLAEIDGDEIVDSRRRCRLCSSNEKKNAQNFGRQR